MDEFASSFKNKLNTRIGEKGILISGGQRQRISIARALYRANDLLILDEATSSLDPRTENKILGNLKIYFPDITIITVAHRYDTLKNCDYWYFIKDGTALAITSKMDLKNMFTTNIPKSHKDK